MFLSLLHYVPYVLSCLTCPVPLVLIPYLLSCSMCLLLYVLLYSLASCPTCSRASCAILPHVPRVRPTCTHASRASCPKCSRALQAFYPKSSRALFASFTMCSLVSRASCLASYNAPRASCTVCSCALHTSCLTCLVPSEPFFSLRTLLVPRNLSTLCANITFCALEFPCLNSHFSIHFLLVIFEGILLKLE